MSINLRLGIVVIALIILISITIILRKGKIPLKYSLTWFLSSIVLLLIAIFPSIFAFVSDLLGFEVMSNMVIGLFIFLLLMITMILTVIVSTQNTKITLLIQEVSILKEKIKDEK